MKVIDVMGMMQARAWKACTLNELRKRLGIETFKRLRTGTPIQRLRILLGICTVTLINSSCIVVLYAEGHAEDGLGHK